MQESFKPELDLYRLYQGIKLNNRTTIEGGSGWSSLLFALTLSELKKEIFKNKKFENIYLNYL